MTKDNKRDIGIPADTGSLRLSVLSAEYADYHVTPADSVPPPQGTVLTIRPRKVAAFDQDMGINAPVSYSFTSGQCALHERDFP